MPQETEAKKKRTYRSTAQTTVTGGSNTKGQDLKRRKGNVKFMESIHKRGTAEMSGKAIEDDSTPVIGPKTLALLIFVVCGSAIFGVFNTIMG